MSLGLDIKRIFREGLITFWRNRVVSGTAVLVMTLSLLVFSSLLFLNAVTNFSIAQLQDRVDINIYFFPEAGENEILELAKRIEIISEVRDVQYVSRDDAYVEFKDRHQDDELINRSLDELGENPLGASLNIRAYDSSQYEAVVRNIEDDVLVTQPGFVEEINYYDNRSMINRLNQFGGVVKTIGYAASGFLALIVLLIVVATMKLSIYSSKHEIIVKRLVGAEHRYIRGPFMVTGLLYGVLSAIFAIGLLYPLTSWIGGFTKTFFGGMDIFSYYLVNFFQIFIILLAIGVVLGIISSIISMKKYLRV